MIVTISGWVFIVISLLGVFQLKHAHGAQLILAAASAALYAIVAAGLLTRRNWGRWLALGLSLCTWTAGALLFLYVTVQFYRMFSALGGVTGRLLATMVILIAVFSAFVWLNFKLFDHLNSDEGREDFGAPDGERYAVTKSTLVQVVWWAVSALTINPTPGGMGRSSDKDFAAALEMVKTARRERATAPAPQPEREVTVPVAQDPQALDGEAQSQMLRLERQAQAQEAEVQRRAQSAARTEARTRMREEFMRKNRELFERRVADRSYTDAQFEADRDRLTREYARSHDLASGASASASRAPASSADSTSKKILRCRDASSSIQYTQGYCPAGTTVVASPPTD